MDAHKVQVRSGDGLTDGAGRVPSLDGESELGIQNASGGEGVGVRVNVGRQSNQNVLHNAFVSGDLVQHAQLVEAIDDDAPDTGLYGELKLLRRFVVSVKIDLFQRHPRRYGDGQLSTGYDVHPHAFLGHQLCNGRVEERLGGIGNHCVGVSGGESVQELTAHAPQSVLVVHEERSAELGCQVRNVTSAEGQVVSGVDSGGHGKQFYVVEGHWVTPEKR